MNIIQDSIFQADNHVKDDDECWKKAEKGQPGPGKLMKDIGFGKMSSLLFIATFAHPSTCLLFYAL